MKSVRGWDWDICSSNKVSSNLAQSFLDKKKIDVSAIDYSLSEMVDIASGQIGFCDAVDIISGCIINKEKIFIFGDYDVDGMSSTSIWLHVCRAFGANVAWDVPLRSHGYGLSLRAIDKAVSFGAGLLICVDSGTDRVSEIDYAKSLGLKTVVIDHHLPKSNDFENGVAKPDALVNGHFDIVDDMARLCAAGQSFAIACKVIDCLEGKLTSSVSVNYVRSCITQLGAIGTISDMMEIVPGFNRTLVKDGLSLINSEAVSSVKLLLQKMFGHEIFGKADVSNVSFGIGPALNAAGRFSRPEVAVSLLSSSEGAIRQADLVAALVGLNDQRKELQARMLSEAMGGSGRAPGVISYVGMDWEKGIVGLVASGLVEALQRPSLAASRVGDIISGSGRSTPEFDLGRVVIEAHKRGIIRGGGGHAAACGYQCDADRWDEFVNFISEAYLSGLMKPLNCFDFEIDKSVLCVSEISALDRLGPFGHGWHRPLVAVRSRITRASIIGKTAETLLVEAGFKGLAFKAKHNGLSALTNFVGSDAIFIGHPEISEFRGERTAELRIKDVIIV